MKRLFILALCVALGGCVGDPVRISYRGPDAGVLVFSAGSIGGDFGLDFFYRKVGQPSGYYTTGGDGTIDYSPGSPFSRKADFTGRESGVVTVHHLEPGEYEVYTWSFTATSPVGEFYYGPQKDFSLPFTIRPRQTTYIGNFSRVRAKDQPPGTFLYFISDKHERDIEIARKKEPNLPPVTIQVTEVSKLGEPSLLAKEPQ